MAEPLTEQQYANWKRKIGVIADMHAHPEEDDPYNDITVNLGMLLRVLATVDDLRRQLREAQEWGKYWWTVSNGLYTAFMSTQAERDAAQEERDDYEGRWSEVLARQNRIVGERITAIKDAEGLRALVERIHKVCKHTLEGDRTPAWYKMVVFDIGQITPAEAQKEAD